MCIAIKASWMWQEKFGKFSRKIEQKNTVIFWNSSYLSKNKDHSIILKMIWFGNMQLVRTQISMNIWILKNMLNSQCVCVA